MAVLDELREGGRLVALLCLSAFVSLCLQIKIFVVLGSAIDVQ